MSTASIPPGPNVPDVVNVLIEIPKGSQNKYEFDKDLNVLKLDRVLFTSMMYPADYGYIPQTLGLDGDPLDAMVLMTNPVPPGVLIEARPIGMLEMIDQGDNDEKILCVPVSDPRFAEFTDIGDVGAALKDEIAHFFATYKQLEKKTVEIRGWHDAAAAKKIVTECVERYGK